MATPPNDKPQPPKKPVPPQAKAPGAPGARPGAPKPGAPGGKPAPKPGAKKPAAKSQAERWGGGDSGTRKIGQVLIDLGFLDEGQVWDLLEEARSSGLRLGQVALERGLINEDQLMQAVAEQAGMRIANLEEDKPTPAATAKVPDTMATLYKVLPLKYEDDVLTVVMSDPGNVPALDDLRNFLGIKQVIPLLAPQKLIEEAITKAYAGKEESIIDIIQALESDTSAGSRKRETSIDLDDLIEISESAPVRKLINMVLLLAIKDQSSDIHFEPFEDEYKMRYRCDGVLYEMVPPPRHLAMAIASRIKVMSNLDIAERRLPQDGRIELNVGGNQVDMRVSVLPTMFGESVVIRVLDRTRVGLALDNIGMPEHIKVDFRKLIRKPNGITLVTGPTGAGKTTTLYSALNELNEITDKIITTEDPVEYEIDGICQVPINHDIDLTFASALRAILRQDPDIILVGEIRDLETAQIAIQASLTGHMVFSTLHTNDAPSTITRMRDMGVEPFLLTATIEGIMAQRLVRKVCQKCKVAYDPTPEQLMELNLRPDQVQGRKFYYGEGCDSCNNLGFRGRTGLYELMMLDDDLRDLISAGASTDKLRAQVRSKGVPGLRDAGIQALYQGVTTLDEVVRETITEDDS